MLANSIALCFDPRGKISRLPYTAGVAVLAVVFFSLFIVRHFEDRQWPTAVFALAALAYVLICLVAKRTRDAGYSMHRLFLLLLPGVNVIYVLFLWIPRSGSSEIAGGERNS
jgi:uncharacterized membrane protein YhaH (DUF805 family)